MPRSTDCPKCQGKMSEGVLVDMGYGQAMASQWQPGPAVVTRFWGLKLRKKEWIPTVTYRCGRCGFLESYANPAS
ncbi:MAG: hypothetical protein ABIR77_06150 [Sphingomicrobium sp.]